MEVNAMTQPRQLDNPLYRLIRNEDIKGFNAQKAKDGPIDLCNGDFRGLDLRALDAQGIAGVCQCWTSAYIKDLVVHPRARGQGLHVGAGAHQLLRVLRITPEIGRLVGVAGSDQALALAGGSGGQPRQHQQAKRQHKGLH